MKTKVLGLYHAHQQLVLYGIIGLSGATLDFLFYLLFYKVLGIPPVIASFLSVSIGILNNFLLNSRHNFKVNDKLLYRFINFYSIGLVGALASSAMILILFNGLGINAALAKLLTIVPVVLLQFYFNRKYSFQALRDESLKNHPVTRLVTRHRLLVAINVVFIIMALFFVVNKAPGESGPDENTHYQYNVEYIIKHHSLPRSGRDDTVVLSACRDGGYAMVRCTYSYQSYPGANYLLSAIGGATWHAVTGGTYLMGARLTAVLEGLIFLNVLYIAILRLTRSRLATAAITASITLIPQVIYTFSYVNQDTHSLMISALLGYALVHFLQQKDRNSTILLGFVLGGALPLAKFNFFILGLAAIVTLFVCYTIKKLSLRNIAQLLGWCIVGFVVLASFWYVRNLVLYHDLTGVTYQLDQMRRYHAQGVARPMSWLTFQEVTQLNFFGQTFNSFFVAYGSRVYGLANYMYGDIGLGLLSLLIASGYIAVRQTKKVAQQRLALAVLLSVPLAICASLAMSYYNSIVYDFQPQGRYLYPVLIVTALAFGQLYRINKQYKYVILGFFCLMTYVFFGGLGTAIQHVLVAR